MKEGCEREGAADLSVKVLFVCLAKKARRGAGEGGHVNDRQTGDVTTNHKGGNFHHQRHHNPASDPPF